MMNYFGGGLGGAPTVGATQPTNPGIQSGGLQFAAGAGFPSMAPQQTATPPQVSQNPFGQLPSGLSFSQPQIFYLQKILSSLGFSQQHLSPLIQHLSGS